MAYRMGAPWSVGCRRCRHKFSMANYGLLEAHRPRSLHITATCLHDEDTSERARRNASANANADIQKLAATSSVPRQRIRKYETQGKDALPRSEARRRDDEVMKQPRMRSNNRGSTQRERSDRGSLKRGRGRGQATDDEYDDSRIEDDMSADEYLASVHEEDFINEEDLEGHQAAATWLETVEEMEEEATALMQEGKESGDDELIKQAEAIQEDIPPLVRHSLTSVEMAEDEALPRHIAETVQLGVLPGQVGGVPIGKTSTGGTIEEGLRALVNRPREVYKDPTLLAKRAFAGNLVKFNNNFEMAKVEERLMSLANTSDASIEDRARSRLQPLSEDARRAIVQRLVSGHYNDVPNGRSESNVLLRPLRYTDGSWDAQSRGTFLETIERLMPVAKPAKQESRA